MAKKKSAESPNATLAPQTRLASASGDILNYVTLASQARPSCEILNYLLSRLSDILLRSLVLPDFFNQQKLY